MWATPLVSRLASFPCFCAFVLHICVCAERQTPGWRDELTPYGQVTRYTSNNEEWYLFTYSTNDNITLRRSKALTDNWDHQETRVVFSPDPRGQDAGQPWSTDLWVGHFLAAH